MNPRTIPISSAALTDELSAWSVGLGILTMALAPLAIPILVLTAVAAIVLLAPVLAVGLLAAVVALPVLLVRSVARRARRAQGRGDAGQRSRADSSPKASTSEPRVA